VIVVSVAATIEYYALLIYFILIWARFILELARNFARGWRPRGVGLVIAELVFTLTDPPIRFVRRLIPPLRIGAVALDFGWSIVLLAVIILLPLTLALRFS
jgi:YggT family protein